MDLEVMYLLSLLNIHYPSNVMRVLQGLQLTSFSQIPNLLGYLAESRHYLSECGCFYNSADYYTLFLVNTGRIIIYLAGILTLKLLFIMFSVLLETRDHNKFVNVLWWLHDRFVYNVLLSVIQISFFEIVISEALQFQYMAYSNLFYSISTMIGYVITLIMLAWILYNLKLTKKLPTHKESKVFRLKISMAEEFQCPRQEFRYIVYEVIQRVWFSIVVVIFINRPMIQLVLMGFANVFLITQVYKWQKVEDKKFKFF